MSRKKAQPDPHPEAHRKPLNSGIAGAIMEQPETQSAFEEWYAIITEEAAKAEKSAPASVRETSTSYTWIRASARQWEPRIYVSVIRLIRGFKFPPLSHGEILLPSGIMFQTLILHQFYAYAVARGKWPWRTGPSLNTILESRHIGEEFQFTVPADWSLRRVRRALRDGLPEFKARVKARVRFIEENDWLSPPPRKPKRPVSDYVKSLHRDGRWLFLVETGRAKKKDLAQEYHRKMSAKHKREIYWPCDSCQAHVNRQINKARRVLAQPEITSDPSYPS